MNTSKKINQVFIILAVLLVVVMAMVVFAYNKNKAEVNKFMETAEEAGATVIEVIREEHEYYDDNDDLRTEIIYTSVLEYSVKGQRIETRIKEYYSKGETLTVFYNPGNPKEIKTENQVRRANESLTEKFSGMGFLFPLLLPVFIPLIAVKIIFSFVHKKRSSGTNE